MANELTFKRLREKVTETMGTQKNLGCRVRCHTKQRERPLR